MHNTKKENLLGKVDIRMRSLIEDRDVLLDVVLRAHLHIELLLDEMLQILTIHPEYMNKAKLKFSQKVNMARSFNLHHSEEGIWDAIFALDSLRNDFAHRLSCDARENKIRKFINVTNADLPNKSQSNVPILEHSIYEELLLCFSYLLSSLEAIKHEYGHRAFFQHDLENRMLRAKFNEE